MPWKAVSAMILRSEFVRLATTESANIRSLCRRYDISPKTAYKWLRRYRDAGLEALADRSRRPHNSPAKTDDRLEALVVELRRKHPAWGPRKLHRRLVVQGYTHLPSVSTIAAILFRYGCIDPIETKKHQPYRRFEAPQPNLLWQMDFKGDFALPQGRCYPLTILDDHSRFSLGLIACAQPRREIVQQHLITTFRRYGLPQRILADNGGPWGSCGYDAYTELGLWLIRLGIGLSHSRVCHPQTLGKDERFHRTLDQELISRSFFQSLDQCQHSFDHWRSSYNFERPHEALAMDIPANRYRPSPRDYPETLPPITYDHEIVRKVGDHGKISFHGKVFKIGKAFHGYPVALRPTTIDGLYNIFFCHEQVAQINLNDHIQPP